MNTTMIQDFMRKERESCPLKGATRDEKKKRERERETQRKKERDDESEYESTTDNVRMNCRMKVHERKKEIRDARGRKTRRER